MLALYERDANGGQGQMVDLALYEANFRITADLVASYKKTGAIRERIGNRNPTFSPAGTFQTSDGRFVQIAAGGDNVFKRLAEVMERTDLLEDERYATASARQQNAEQLEGILADWVAARDFAVVESSLCGR